MSEIKKKLPLVFLKFYLFGTAMLEWQSRFFMLRSTVCRNQTHRNKTHNRCK